LQYLVAGRATKSSKIAELMERRVATVGVHANAAELPKIFERGEVALVVDESRHVLGILTKLDLIEVLATRRKASVG
jgi:cystathionine beta-synthase